MVEQSQTLGGPKGAGRVWLKGLGRREEGEAEEVPYVLHRRWHDAQRAEGEVPHRRLPHLGRSVVAAEAGEVHDSASVVPAVVETLRQVVQAQASSTLMTLKSRADDAAGWEAQGCHSSCCWAREAGARGRGSMMMGYVMVVRAAR